MQPADFAVSDQGVKTIRKAQDLHGFGRVCCRTNDSPNHRIESGTVPAAGKNTDSHASLLYVPLRLKR
jgi:hypothetical protein